MFKTINATEATTLMQSETVQVLDMRDVRSYRAGHLEGAMMFHEGLERSLLDDGNYGVPLLLYCYRGIQSKEKAAELAARGFERVYTLDGGYTDWPR